MTQFLGVLVKHYPELLFGIDLWGILSLHWHNLRMIFEQWFLLAKDDHLGLPLQKMLAGERHPVWTVIWKESESKLMYSGGVLGSLSFPVKLS